MILSKASGATRCVFPKGELNRRCVECQVDTLYENVESYTYSAINPDHWYRRQIIRNNQSYHKLVEVCYQKHPFVGSNRVCVSSCTGKEMVVGNRKFCRDNIVNNGFCVITHVKYTDSNAITWSVLKDILFLLSDTIIVV